MISQMTRRLAALALAAAVAVTPLAAQTSKPKSDIDKVGDSVESMAEKPLKDMNIVKDKIPPELVAVMAKPYDLTGISGCAGYKAEIDKLTRILGPDVDSPKVQGQKASAAEVALSGAEAVVGSLIPGTGFIRKLSGAEAEQKKAQAAVLAGDLRRAYIKGTARAKGCKV